MLVSRLRRTFPTDPGAQPIESVGRGYRLNSAAVHGDAAEFEAIARRAHRLVAESRWEPAINASDEALAL